MNSKELNGLLSLVVLFPFSWLTISGLKRKWDERKREEGRDGDGRD